MFGIKKILHLIIGLFYGCMLLSACNFGIDKADQPEVKWDTLQVTASAYNSLNYQTGDGDPNITAWGDTLKPGIKTIAVSRDLIRKGLTHNTPVKIKGFSGVYLVKDKMHHRWNNKIDIYMDKNVQKAKNFGRKKVEIYVAVKNDSLLKAKLIEEARQ